MFNKLIFFNAFGAGDIFESREFVKEIMNIVPAKEYFYAHGKYSGILLDIPQLKFTKFRDEFDNRKSIINLSDNSLAWNTWIGRDSKYVLSGIGCVVEELYKMHNDILSALGYRRLSKLSIEYIPSIDYKYYGMDKVNKFIKRAKDRVLIDNGNVQSNQAYNFDFSPIIERLVTNYPEIDFIITHRINHIAKNLFTTAEIIQSESSCDLNEISYLSLFCDTIIGRNSGPFVFAQVKENWMDETKAILSFTYTQEGSTFVLNQPVKMKKFWSPRTDPDSVYDMCRKVIER